jgi:hypothetical protein
MDPHSYFISNECVFGDDRWGDDIFKPVVQPLFDRPRLPGLADLALFASLFQIANFLGDRCFVLPRTWRRSGAPLSVTPTVT